MMRLSPAFSPTSLKISFGLPRAREAKKAESEALCVGPLTISDVPSLFYEHLTLYVINAWRRDERLSLLKRKGRVCEGGRRTETDSSTALSFSLIWFPFFAINRYWRKCNYDISFALRR